MKDLNEQVYQRATSYAPPFPKIVIDILLTAAGIVSGYGSGYFFYWILNIGGQEDIPFDYTNPMWYLGMLIGLLISVDIYTGSFRAGQYFAFVKLYENDKDERKEPYEIFKKFSAWLSGIRLFAKFTTVIGFACLFYGKIDLQLQDTTTQTQVITAKQAELDSLQAHPLPLLATLPEYLAEQRLLNNGDPADDAGARLEKDRISQRYYAKADEREGRIKVLKAEIEGGRIAGVKVNNLALFAWLSGLVRLSKITIMVLSVLIAGIVLDQVFSRLGKERGELSANRNVKRDFLRQVDASTSLTGLTRLTPVDVNVNGFTQHLTTAGEKIEQIRKRYKGGDQSILNIVHQLNNTSLSYKKIGQDNDCSAAWVGYVQEMLRQEKDNARA